MAHSYKTWADAFLMVFFELMTALVLWTIPWLMLKILYLLDFKEVNPAWYSDKLFLWIALVGLISIALDFKGKER